MIKGKARRLPQDDNVNTDYIISGRRKFSIQDTKKLAGYIFEDLDPGFSRRLKKGDFLVVGKNFGSGSSREQAPLALKEAGIGAVLAKSFARIFYRNSINIGLLPIECDTTSISEGDEIEIDPDYGKLKDLTKGIDIETSPLSGVMKQILDDGGLIDYFRKHGGFKFDA